MSLFRTCANGFHRFEPRYDEVENELLRGLTSIEGRGSFRDELIKRIYVKDICIVCGKEIKK